MVSKHTPGPWTPYDCAAYGTHITKGGIGGQMVASVQQYVGVSAEVYYANVRIIAAAPDMLDALEAMMAAHLDGAGSPIAVGEAWQMARAAIAKARGE